MQRTVDDYDSMAKREIIKAKQEKAMMCVGPFHASLLALVTLSSPGQLYTTRRVQKFRADYVELRSQVERYKVEVRTLQACSSRSHSLTAPQHEATSRAELLGASSSSTPMSPGAGAGDTRRRFLSGQQQQQQSAASDVSESPFRGPAPMGSLREQHAMREHTFAQETESRLDDLIAQGRAALDDLVDQRNVLKGTQRRLLDAANTLGLSRDVIGWIERRRCVVRLRSRDFRRLG